MRIAVLVTCFNRVETTRVGLKALLPALQRVEGIDFQIFLVDDASPDETGTKMAEEFPGIIVTRSHGGLYWNRGMCLAYETARQSKLEFDAYLLFNDDTLIERPLNGFFEAFTSGSADVLAGAFTAGDHTTVTYSGFNQRSRARPFTFVVPDLTGQTTPAHSFNANFVLIRAALFERLGGLDRRYSHALGDLDFGLRASAAGGRTEIYSEPIGVCERGPSMSDRMLALRRRQRWAQLIGAPFGPGPYFLFAWNHGYRVMFPLFVAKVLLDRFVLALR